MWAKDNIPKSLWRWWPENQELWWCQRRSKVRGSTSTCRMNYSYLEQSNLEELMSYQSWSTHLLHPRGNGSRKWTEQQQPVRLQRTCWRQSYSRRDYTPWEQFELMQSTRGQIEAAYQETQGYQVLDELRGERERVRGDVDMENAMPSYLRLRLHQWVWSSLAFSWTWWTSSGVDPHARMWLRRQCKLQT